MLLQFNIEHDAQNGDNPEVSTNHFEIAEDYIPYCLLQTDVEDKGGTTSSIPVAVEEVGGSSAVRVLVAEISCNIIPIWPVILFPYSW